MKDTDHVSDFDACSPWKCCEILAVIKHYLVVDIQMSRVRGIYPVAHKPEVKYCALQEHIIKMKTSSISGICLCNQDNKERKKRKNRDRDRVGKDWVKQNDEAGPSYFTALGKIHFAILSPSHSYMCRPTGKLWIMCCRNMPYKLPACPQHSVALQNGDINRRKMQSYEKEKNCPCPYLVVETTACGLKGCWMLVSFWGWRRCSRDKWVGKWTHLVLCSPRSFWYSSVSLPQREGSTLFALRSVRGN